LHIVILRSKATTPDIWTMENTRKRIAAGLLGSAVDEITSDDTVENCHKTMKLIASSTPKPMLGKE